LDNLSNDVGESPSAESFSESTTNQTQERNTDPDEDNIRESFELALGKLENPFIPRLSRDSIQNAGLPDDAGYLTSDPAAQELISEIYESSQHFSCNEIAVFQAVFPIDEKGSDEISKLAVIDRHPTDDEQFSRLIWVAVAAEAVEIASADRGLVTNLLEGDIEALSAALGSGFIYNDGRSDCIHRIGEFSVDELIEALKALQAQRKAHRAHI
jgi:hypothetical protein